MLRLAFALLCAAALVARPAAADRHLGLSLDAGGPHGLGANLVVKPVSWFRVEAGGTTDLAAPGVRGGFSLTVPWYIGPSLSAEAGYQWPGNFNHLARLVSGTDPRNALLDRVGYRYASLRGGLELGGPDTFVITLHAGYSAIYGRTSGLPAWLASQFSDASVRVRGEASLRVIAPSAAVGLLFYVH